MREQHIGGERRWKEDDWWSRERQPEESRIVEQKRKKKKSAEKAGEARRGYQRNAEGLSRRDGDFRKNIRR